MKNALKLLVLSFLIGCAFALSVSAVPVTRGGGGAGATASPTASPSPGLQGATGFISPGSAPTLTIPAGGATPAAAGDCMILMTEGNGAANTPGLTQASANNVGFANLAIGQTWSVNRVYWPYLHTLSPIDITSGHFTLTGIGIGFGVCAAFFRHVTCGYDNVSTFANGTSTAPRPNSVTGTLNGDMAVSVGMINSSSGTATYTSPGGVTSAVKVNPINGTGAGCYIDYQVLGAAGAFQPAAGTLSASNDWGATTILLGNLGLTQ